MGTRKSLVKARAKKRAVAAKAKSQQRTARDREVLKPLADAWFRLVHQVEFLSEADLLDLDAATKRLTETNCWWAEWGAAIALRPVIDASLLARQRAKAARSAPPA